MKEYFCSLQIKTPLLVAEKNGGNFGSVGDTSLLCLCVFSHMLVTSVTVRRFLLLVQKIVLMRHCCQACDHQGYLKQHEPSVESESSQGTVGDSADVRSMKMKKGQLTCSL